MPLDCEKEIHQTLKVVLKDSKIKKFVTGYSHAVVLCSDGKVYVGGKNSDGQNLF